MEFAYSLTVVNLRLSLMSTRGIRSFVMHKIAFGFSRDARSRGPQFIWRPIVLSTGIYLASIILHQPVLAAAIFTPSTAPAFDKGHLLSVEMGNGVAAIEPLVQGFIAIEALDAKQAVSTTITVQRAGDLLTPVSLPTSSTVQPLAKTVEVILPPASGSQLPEPTTWAMLIVGFGVVALNIRGMSDRSNRIH